MKIIVRIFILGLVAANLGLLAHGARAGTTDSGIAEAAESSPVAGHLELGTRVTAFLLTDDKNAGFLGTIDELKEEQDYRPFNLFADWMFTPEFGVELTWESYKAETATDSSDGHSDGTLRMGGPMITALWRIPTEYIYTPYLTAGLGYMMSHFDEATWWELGYSSKDSWQELGSPNTVRNGIERDIDVDDEVAFILGGGTDIYLTERWHLDASVRYVYADVDARYSETRSGVEIAADHGHFSMGNLTFGLGVRYAF